MKVGHFPFSHEISSLIRSIFLSPSNAGFWLMNLCLLKIKMLKSQKTLFTWLKYWLRCVLVAVLCQPVLSHRSKLKVAVCNPGLVPFVMIGANGRFEGFDIGL